MQSGGKTTSTLKVHLDHLKSSKFIKLGGDDIYRSENIPTRFWVNRSSNEGDMDWQKWTSSSKLVQSSGQPTSNLWDLLTHFEVFKNYETWWRPSSYVKQHLCKILGQSDIKQRKYVWRKKPRSNCLVHTTCAGHSYKSRFISSEMDKIFIPFIKKNGITPSKFSFPVSVYFVRNLGFQSETLDFKIHDFGY